MLRKYRSEVERNDNEYQLSSNNDSFTVDTSSVSTSENEKTVIGEHISIDGTIRAKEDLVIQGSLKGSMELEKNHITIGSKANVEADIKAQSMTMSGKMNGNVSIHGKIEITREAKFMGQIKAKSISIEDGAYIKASIEMEREEDKKSKPASTRPMDAVVLNKETQKEKQDKKPVNMVK